MKYHAKILAHYTLPYFKKNQLFRSSKKHTPYFIYHSLLCIIFYLSHMYTKLRETCQLRLQLAFKSILFFIKSSVDWDIISFFFLI